jgi:hypothetical protein
MDWKLVTTYTIYYIPKDIGGMSFTIEGDQKKYATPSLGANELSALAELFMHPKVYYNGKAFAVTNS